jgi:hypothetical protein
MAAHTVGRPQWKPTARDQELVRLMVTGGIDQARIAAAIGVARKPCIAIVAGISTAARILTLGRDILDP